MKDGRQIRSRAKQKVAELDSYQGNFIPHAGHFPGLSNSSLSQSRPHGGPTKTVGRIKPKADIGSENATTKFAATTAAPLFCKSPGTSEHERKRSLRLYRTALISLQAQCQIKLSFLENGC
jgi:hypothetical protein